MAFFIAAASGNFPISSAARVLDAQTGSLWFESYLWKLLYQLHLELTHGLYAFSK